MGEIAARASSTGADAAAMRFREALALADVLGMRPLAAHCHASLGKLHRRADDEAGARAYLATAMTMYREMDMRFWLAGEVNR